jgi:hypothetical protein
MRAILAAAIVAMVPAAAHAQVREIITVQQGLQTVLQFTEPFSAASVGDSTIIDAMPRSDRIIVLQGKQPGATDILTFYDGKVSRHITVTVQPASAAGKVITHNKKNLTEYTAYSCGPGTCARMKDDFEGKDVFLFGPGGSVIGVGTTGSTVIAPPAPGR